jgi:mono/diheme cytochrome c family protein
MNHSLERKAFVGEISKHGDSRSRSKKLSLEKRALVWALLCGSVSLAGALLMATPIQKMEGWPFFTGRASAEIAVSPQLLAQGAAFYAQSCGDCHGDDGHGDEGPDLHNLAISDARIASQIKTGTKGEMPSFAKKYHAEQIAALVAYVRTLR